MVRKIFKHMVLWLNIAFIALLLFSYLAPYVNPQKFVLPSYLGLFFFYIVLVNLAFVVFWLLWSKWYFLLSAVVLLAGYQSINRSLPYRFSENRITAPGAIKVMSYNVRVFNRYNWNKEGSVKAIADFARSQNADIICFQEFGVNNKYSATSESTVTGAFKNWKHRYIEYSKGSSKNLKHGLAIFSKYPILRTGIIEGGSRHNFSVYADIKKGDQTIRVVNCHLESIRLDKKDKSMLDILEQSNQQITEDVGVIGHSLAVAYKNRAKQANEIEQHVSKSPFPVIICCDMNDTPMSYAYKKLKGDLNDGYVVSGKGNGTTYNGQYPWLRIDYIFHDSRFTSNGFKSHKVTFSDHFPVTCYIEPIGK